LNYDEVSVQIDSDKKGYNFKNISNPCEALAGLQILSEYFKILG